MIKGTRKLTGISFYKGTNLILGMEFIHSQRFCLHDLVTSLRWWPAHRGLVLNTWTSKAHNIQSIAVVLFCSIDFLLSLMISLFSSLWKIPCYLFHVWKSAWLVTHATFSLPMFYVENEFLYGIISLYHLFFVNLA
jgi:hypothetical protein